MPLLHGGRCARHGAQAWGARHNRRMNIQLLSDLHLEAHPDFVPQPAPGADLLVLAGDIGSYQPGSRLAGALDDGDFGLSRFSPRKDLAGWPVPVLFVPGNHEYDLLDFDATHDRLRATCERLGITWLEREVVVLGGVRFVGTTLWSDYDALASLPEPAPKAAPRPVRPGKATAAQAAATLTPPPSPLTRRLQLREKAYRAANHFLRKAATVRGGELFLAEPMRAQALVCQQWLREALAQPFDGATVVVTHFAPSLLSADPRYGLVPGTAGFCNALDALLPQADLWLHGHLHCAFDYVSQGCRVVANPLGYARNGEQDRFQPQFCVSVPPARRSSC